MGFRVSGLGFRFRFYGLIGLTGLIALIGLRGFWG